MLIGRRQYCGGDKGIQEEKCNSYNNLITNNVITNKFITTNDIVKGIKREGGY